MNRREMEREYKSLGNELPQYHPNKSFQNHCYWRIALDNAVGEQWNKKISSPAYKKITDEQLLKTNQFLRLYIKDRKLLEKHNEQSLIYRGKSSAS